VSIRDFTHDVQWIYSIVNIIVRSKTISHTNVLLQDENHASGACIGDQLPLLSLQRPTRIAHHEISAATRFINSDMLVVRALKNSQLIRQLPGESHAIYGTGH
jgi:hypothetical protein